MKHFYRPLTARIAGAEGLDVALLSKDGRQGEALHMLGNGSGGGAAAAVAGRIFLVVSLVLMYFSSSLICVSTVLRFRGHTSPHLRALNSSWPAWLP